MKGRRKEGRKKEKEKNSEKKENDEILSCGAMFLDLDCSPLQIQHYLSGP